ncbi:MAG: 4-hydroxy-3-methylbut-2-enyl diphosphate reductase [Planctomycetota bacterium]|nr:MAG: 4-hydroxy-3-methylbut-2-enyl diphosphate reductase [Planctomycetota bacterium]
MTAPNTPLQTVIAKPRGFCAGVDRAIKVVEEALALYKPPIYVRKEIVHNKSVVRRLREAGAVFIDEVDAAPPGSILILSAHGSPPWVYERARERGLRLIDATCPLVTKVHREVHRYVRKGYRIVFIGHAGHDEVIGTMGQAPERTVLVETVADARALDLPPDEPGVILTQTTLSQDDTAEIVDVLRRRFPRLELPPSDDICYATQNRQNAVKQIAPEIDLLLVVGSQNSSNSQRLTEVARARGIEAHLIDGPEDIDPDWLTDRRRIGVTSGASAPEQLVQAVVEFLSERGAIASRELDAPDENVTFRMPPLVQLNQS